MSRSARASQDAYNLVFGGLSPDRSTGNNRSQSLVLNWVRSNVMKIINRDKISIENFSITPKKLAELLGLLNKNRITKENANKIFDLMILENLSASEIMVNLNLEVSTNEEELNSIINRVMRNFPNELDRLYNGEKKLIKFFMGQIMKQSKGKYPPNLIMDELNKIVNDR